MTAAGCSITHQIALQFSQKHGNRFLSWHLCIGCGSKPELIFRPYFLLLSKSSCATLPIRTINHLIYCSWFCEVYWDHVAKVISYTKKPNSKAYSCSCVWRMRWTEFFWDNGCVIWFTALCIWFIIFLINCISPVDMWGGFGGGKGFIIFYWNMIFCTLKHVNKKLYRKNNTLQRRS